MAIFPSIDSMNDATIPPMSTVFFFFISSTLKLTETTFIPVAIVTQVFFWYCNFSGIHRKTICLNCSKSSADNYISFEWFDLFNFFPLNCQRPKYMNRKIKKSPQVMQQHSGDTYSEIPLWFLLKKLENFQWCVSSLFSINFAAIVKKRKKHKKTKQLQCAPDRTLRMFVFVGFSHRHSGTQTYSPSWQELTVPQNKEIPCRNQKASVLHSQVFL